MVKSHLIYQLEVTGLSDIEKEIVSAILDSNGVAAIEDSGPAEIRIYHEEESYLQSQVSSLQTSLTFLNQSQFEISTIVNQNWNQVWESSFEPIVIDGFCTVRATFHDKSPSTPYEIVINPELAFGTGHHETTYQMMAAMKDLDLEQKLILDYGCGTGILAILARQLNAGSIDAIDYDQQAIDCAQTCLQLNQSRNINLYVGELEALRHKQYDVILANINRNVLLGNAIQLGQMQEPSGVLLLSGILTEDESLIRTAYKDAGYQLQERNQKGNWLCLKMMKH